MTQEPQPSKDQPLWRQYAACTGLNPEVFYPQGRPLAVSRAIERAQFVCSKCPVKEPCLAYALANETLGVWGGVWLPDRLRPDPVHHAVGQWFRYMGSPADLRCSDCAFRLFYGDPYKRANELVWCSKCA